MSTKNRHEFSNLAAREVDVRGLQTSIINLIKNKKGAFEWADNGRNLIVTVENKTARVSVNNYGEKLETQEQLANRSGHKFFNATDLKGAEAFFKQTFK